MSWDPARYLNFSDERLRPAADLIAQIPCASPATILDLGCGPGTVTRLLAERWPDADITGLDASSAMLTHARENCPGVRWIEADLATCAAPRRADLVFSNAALHWLPDHPGLFARLRGWVAPGGVLAVQMPDNFSAPSHRSIAELAQTSPFAEALGDARMGAVLAAEAYYDLFAGLGAQTRIWSVETLQALRGEAPVLEWLRGTTLVPYLAALGPRAPEFLDRLAARLLAAYPQRADGTTLFPFRRIFIVATF